MKLLDIYCNSIRLAGEEYIYHLGRYHASGYKDKSERKLAYDSFNIARDLFRTIIEKWIEKRGIKAFIRMEFGISKYGNRPMRIASVHTSIYNNKGRALGSKST